MQAVDAAQVRQPGPQCVGDEGKEEKCERGCASGIQPVQRRRRVAQQLVHGALNGRSIVRRRWTDIAVGDVRERDVTIDLRMWEATGGRTGGVDVRPRHKISGAPVAYPSPTHDSSRIARRVRVARPAHKKGDKVEGQ